MRRAPTLLLLGLLTACGGSSAPATSKTDIAALETRAAMTGCVAVDPTLAVAVVHCTYTTELITLATFVNNSQRDLWARANQAAAGGQTVEGDEWAAIVLDQQVATDLAVALDGTVRP